MKLKALPEKHEKLFNELSYNIEKSKKIGEKIKSTAFKERSLILDSAKKEADEIIKDALYKSNKIEKQAEMLRENITDFKKQIDKIKDRDEYL